MDNGTDRSKSYELVDYWVVLRRRWVWVAAGLVIGLLLAGAYLHLASKTYTSTANVLVTPTTPNSSSSSAVANGRTSTAVNLDTESQIVTSTVVASEARTILKSTTPTSTLSGNVSISVPPNSSILGITYTAATPAQAQRGALAFAQAYLAHRTTTAKADVASQAAALKKQIAGLNTQLAQVTGRIAAEPSNSPDRALAQAQQNTISMQLSNLTTTYNQLTSTAVTPGSIIGQPQLPSSPATPRVSYALVGGLLAGLLLGLAMAVIRQKVDHRISDSADLERRLDLPVLVSLPRGRRRRPNGLAGSATPHGEVFRRLANQIQAALGDRHRVVLVAPVAPGSGPSVVAPNLSAALARGGANVILVCADPASASTTHVIDAAGVDGLAEIMYNGRTIEDVIQQPTQLPRLLVVGPGVRPELKTEGVPNDKAGRLLNTLRATADYVIVEGPPTSTSADAQTLASLVDATVVTVEPKIATQSQVIDGIRQLDGVGSDILGCVLTPTVRWATKQDAAPGHEEHGGFATPRHPSSVATKRPGGSLPQDSNADAIATGSSPES